MDLADALERVIFGAFYQSGQSCIGVQRILIHRAVYDRFKEMLVLDIGEGVARARGRYGTEMSDDDARAVALAAQLLGVERYPVDDL